MGKRYITFFTILLGLLFTSCTPTPEKVRNSPEKFINKTFTLQGRIISSINIGPFKLIKLKGKKDLKGWIYVLDRSNIPRFNTYHGTVIYNTYNRKKSLNFLIPTFQITKAFSGATPINEILTTPTAYYDSIVVVKARVINLQPLKINNFLLTLTDGTDTIKFLSDKPIWKGSKQRYFIAKFVKSINIDSTYANILTFVPGLSHLPLISLNNLEESIIKYKDKKVLVAAKVSDLLQTHKWYIYTIKNDEDNVVNVPAVASKRIPDKNGNYALLVVDIKWWPLYHFFAEKPYTPILIDKNLYDWLYSPSTFYLHVKSNSKITKNILRSKNYVAIPVYCANLWIGDAKLVDSAYPYSPYDILFEVRYEPEYKTFFGEHTHIQPGRKAMKEIYDITRINLTGGYLNSSDTIVTKVSYDILTNILELYYDELKYLYKKIVPKKREGKK